MRDPLLPSHLQVSRRDVLRSAALMAGAIVGCSNARRVQPARVMYSHGAVATVNPLATDAAADVLKAGGTAIDAAVSALLTLGVVDGHNSGIGGGCFILIRLADGTTHAIDGRETAPARSTADMYVRNGSADPSLSQTGPLASGVPGMLRACEAALKAGGKRTLSELLLPAAERAERGFPIDRSYAGKIKRTLADIQRFPETARILLHEDGSPRIAGDELRQPDLAATYRSIAKHGVDWFYQGEFARRVAEWMQQSGGLLTEQDFAGYQVRYRQALSSSYRGRTVLGFPPPSSGGLHVAQILEMIERFDLAGMSDVDRITTIANAMQLAFADRAHWLGDPDFVDVPRGLLDAGYLQERSRLIRSDRAIVVESHGQPPMSAGLFNSQLKKHTTHVSVSDQFGNVVSATSTINTAFGSKVIVPGTGVLLNNEMDDFSLQPGVPNHFKLIGAKANEIAPGKRPLSSMSPTIILENDRPSIVVGAAGGPKIITQVVCMLTNLIDLGLNPIEAMRRPRFHHQWSPAKLWIEKSADPALRQELTSRGFDLEEAEPSGATNLIAFSNQIGEPVSEPRLMGKATTVLAK